MKLYVQFVMTTRNKFNINRQIQSLFTICTPGHLMMKLTTNGLRDLEKNLKITSVFLELFMQAVIKKLI